MLSFTTTPYTVNSHLIIRLPAELSAKLTSRSQVMGTGTVNDIAYTGPIEPDGRGGHWIDATSIQSIHEGGEAVVHIKQTDEWPEPRMPQEFLDMLASHPEAKATYDKATPMAHWEWLRWTLATKNPDTYKKHIEVSRSKLTKGMLRPCCFNRSACTVADVAKNARLIEAHEVV